MSYIDKARDALIENETERAALFLLFSIAEDTQKLLQIAEKNQRYIEQTMKEMGHDRGSETQ